MLWLILKSIAACGWSAITYMFTGVPKDKTLPFFAQWFGFADKSKSSWALDEAIDDYDLDPSFHQLKNVLVEWVRVWPQRAAKLGSMVVLVQAAIIWTQAAVIVWVLL